MRIISASLGGIANRIFCLINCIYLAKNNNYEVELYWGEDKDCNGNKRFDLKFNDLFERKIKIVSKEDVNKAFDNKDYIVYSSCELLPSKKEIIEILKSLKFKKKIRYYYNDFSFDAGFHIRRGDFLNIGIANVSPLHKFQEIINNTKGNIYIASDDKNISKNYSYNNPKDDLECLSVCKVIYCSYGSTFSKLAWYLGNCKPILKEVIDEEALKEWKKKEEKNKTILNEFKKLVYELLIPRKKRFWKV